MIGALGPGRLVTAMPAGARIAHQAVAGVGHQRRPRIADQRHGLVAHRLEQPLAVAHRDA